MSLTDNDVIDGAGVGTLYGRRLTDGERDARIAAGAVTVAVYGLGKMGLPLASVFAEVTGDVVGVDVDPDVVETLERGECHVAGEPGLPELVAEQVDAGRLRATTDGPAAAADAAVHVIVVPTLVDEEGAADTSAVESVVVDVATGLSPGDLVIVESTLPPGTTTDTLLPLLERESGLERGAFGLAFCPERTLSGRALADIRDGHPKVVGGTDEESTAAAARLYAHVTDSEVVAVSDATTAETVKILEGVYRDVNIALANEIARHTGELGIDVVEAIDVANTQPYCDVHVPGAGVGGHCIPYYSQFVIEGFETDAPLLETAREVNDGMPEYTATHALDGLRAEGIDPGDADVLVLGLTYRSGVDEIRHAPAIPLIETLAEAGTTVDAVDPVLSGSNFDPVAEAGATRVPFETLEDGDATYDAVVLVTDQPSFDSLDVTRLGRDDGGAADLVVVDGRQALDELRGADGVHYRGVGIVRDRRHATATAGRWS